MNRALLRFERAVFARLERPAVAWSVMTVAVVVWVGLAVWSAAGILAPEGCGPVASVVAPAGCPR